MRGDPNKTMNTGRKESLSVENLYAGYRGNMVVQGISLQIAIGEFVGLVGHNGSGKSTALLGMAGLVQHKCTNLRIDECDCTSTSVRKRKLAGLGILLQRDAVFPNLSIELNLLLSGGADLNRFRPYSQLYDIAKEITNRKSVPAGLLSGGERRLLGLLMSMASSPRYFIVDEPTLGMDADLEVEIIEMLRNYAHVSNTAVLLVSHNLELVSQKCNRAYIIKEGFISKEVVCGTTENKLTTELQISQS